MEDPLSVLNSEASEVSLRLLAASPVATRLLEDGLFSGSEQGKNVEEGLIPFDKIGQTFTLASLVMFGITHKLPPPLLLLLFHASALSVNNTAFYVFPYVLQAGDLYKSKAAWLSYMVHIGGLTFCVGKKALRIPNLVAAERIGSDKLHTSLEDVNNAFRSLINDGLIDKIVELYARGMQQRDVGVRDFQKKEVDHCNSMRFTLLVNIHPSLRKAGVETTITKV